MWTGFRKHLPVDFYAIIFAKGEFQSKNGYVYHSNDAEWFEKYKIATSIANEYEVEL